MAFVGSTMGVRRDDSDYASKVQAALARADWNDYKKTFMPIHRQFKEAVTSDRLVNEQLARVPENIDNAFSTAQKGNDMRMSRMGLSAAMPTQQQDMDKALATVGAENNIRLHSKDRSLAMIAGAPLPTSGG